MATVTDRTAAERWEKENAAAPLREQPPTTVSSVPIEALYTPDSLGNFDPDADLGYPGQYPFTRGVHASMYRSRLWTMRQFAGFGTARQTNQRFKFLLDKGQTGLSTAFDLPTLMGLDSDDPRSLGEVGRLGVAVDTLDDMKIRSANSRTANANDDISALVDCWIRNLFKRYKLGAGQLLIIITQYGGFHASTSGGR